MLGRVSVPYFLNTEQYGNTEIFEIQKLRAIRGISVDPLSLQNAMYCLQCFSHLLPDLNYIFEAI